MAMSLHCAEPATLFLLFLQEIISDRPIFPAGILDCGRPSERKNSRKATDKRTTVHSCNENREFVIMALI
jgi:hypothetical protein